MKKQLLLALLLSGSALAQNLHFARLEVRVSWEEKKQKKYEIRVYYSQTMSPDNSDLRTIANLEKYFDDGIVKPMAQRGIELKYYDSDIKLFPASYAFENEAEAKAQRDHLQEADRSNHYAIYNFTWNYNGEASGEDTTQPQRVWSDKPAPAKEKTAVKPADHTAEKAQQAKDAEERAQATAEKQIWAYASVNVRVKNKKGEEFSRQYVSEIVPVSRDDYNAQYNTDERFIKPIIWKYLNDTVGAAAAARGETLIEPYDGSIEYKFSLTTRNGEWDFQPKSVLQQPHQDQIDYAKQSKRPVFSYRWDPSGKNLEQDLQKEKARKTNALP